MTGFDPTAPARDTDQDEPTPFPDNVVPPAALEEDAPEPEPVTPTGEEPAAD